MVYLKKYRLTIEPGRYLVPRFGEIDLNTLTDGQAEALFAKGFPYLERKPQNDQPADAPAPAVVKKIEKKKRKAKSS